MPIGARASAFLGTVLGFRYWFLQNVRQYPTKMSAIVMFLQELLRQAYGDEWGKTGSSDQPNMK